MLAVFNPLILYSASRIRLTCLCITVACPLMSGLTQTEAHAAQVTLRWDYSASGAAGFMLYCGPSSRNYPTRIDVGNTETYAIGTLKEGSTSYCAVTVYDPGKVESGYSNEASFVVPYSTAISAGTTTATATVDTTPPSVPLGLTATTGGTAQINLAWSASKDNVGVTGYRIERCQGAGCTNFALQVATASAMSSYSDTGLAAGTSYSYRMRARDGAGNLSGYSSIASAITQVVTGRRGSKRKR